MKDSNDIANLYKTLGQNPNLYQEVVRDEELAQANDRWPLIAAMHDSDFSPPPVDQKKRGVRERPPVVVLEHVNELDERAHDYHDRVETVKAIELLADPSMTPSWAPAMHDVAEVVRAEPHPDLIETGWVAPKRTPAQIELAARAAEAAQAAHQAQAVKEAPAAKEAQAQRDAEAAQEEQAELAAEAAKEAYVLQEARAAQLSQSAQAVEAAQAARHQQAAMAKTAVQAAKPTAFEPPVQVAPVVKKVISYVEVNKKAVATVSTSIFQDDTTVVFAGAPASIFSESSLAESLMDEATSEFDEIGDELETLIQEEEEIAPVIANPRRQRVAAEPMTPPKAAIAAEPAPRVVAKAASAPVPEPAAVVTLTHMRMRATGEPRPLAALFSRLSGSAPDATGAVEGAKKSLLFERMKRT